MTPAQLKDFLVEILKEKKTGDITIIDVAGKTTIADYFIIVSGKNGPQVSSLCDHLEEKAEEKGIFASRKEGVREARWVVMDYSSVIVHIFNDATRDFYCLEKLWSDADSKNITIIS